MPWDATEKSPAKLLETCAICRRFPLAHPCSGPYRLASDEFCERGLALLFMAKLHANGAASDPRAAALQRLLAILQRRNLVHWRVTLLLWLNRFDGLCEFLPGPDELPDHQVCLILTQLPESVSDAELAQCLSQADFLTWRVRHAVSHTLWSFVDQPFADFVRDADPVVYQLDIEHPAPDVTAHWLLTQQSQVQ